jgi:hypothetical protein
LFHSRVPASLRYSTFVALLLLGSLVPSLAQSSAVNSFNSRDGEPFAVPLSFSSDSVTTVPAPKPPALITLTTGWTYLWADQGNDYRSNLNGWFARPSVDIGRGYSIFFDSTNYYGTNSKGSTNSHGFTLGVAKNVLATTHVKPSIFIEAGNVRVSSAGAITNEAAVATGFSFTVPMTNWVSLAITPVEYVFLYPKGDWRNDYNAKVGFSFPIGHRSTRSH